MHFMIANIVIAAALMQPATELTLPRIDIPQALRATDCSNAQQREALLNQSEQMMETLRPATEEMNRRLERRMEAHASRLIELGVWTANDRSRFGMALLNRPDFNAYMDEGMTVLSGMMSSLETIASEESGEPERCEAMLSMIGSLDRTFALAETGWRVIDTAYAEEARRLGVSLD